MRKSLMVVLITILAVFSIRIVYQTINIKRQMPQIEKISEALKYGKESDEMWESLAENMRKRGATGGHAPHLSAGVVEITFYECPAPLQKRPYTGLYEIYSVRGTKILEGNSLGDGSPVSHKINPGAYVIRVPGRDVGEEFTIYESDTWGKRLIVAVPAPGKSRKSMYSSNY